MVWRRLRAVQPARTGILILDETSFPKQGPHSVAAARQYCGALGKVAMCQVAVTAALWTGGRAWPLGALLYRAGQLGQRSRAAAHRAHPHRAAVSGEVAPRVDPVAADPRQSACA